MEPALLQLLERRLTPYLGRPGKSAPSSGGDLTLHKRAFGARLSRRGQVGTRGSVPPISLCNAPCRVPSRGGQYACGTGGWRRAEAVRVAESGLDRPTRIQEDRMVNRAADCCAAVISRALGMRPHEPERPTRAPPVVDQARQGES